MCNCSAKQSTSRTARICTFHLKTNRIQQSTLNNVVPLLKLKYKLSAFLLHKLCIFLLFVLLNKCLAILLNCCRISLLNIIGAK